MRRETELTTELNGWPGLCCCPRPCIGVVARSLAPQPPIQLDFNIPMYTSSGMQVLYLKVWEKSGYETTKWVRKLTKAGDFSVRCTDGR